MPKEKSEVVKMRLSVSTKEKIQKIADKEYRSFAKQCQLMLDEWLERRDQT